MSYAFDAFQTGKFHSYLGRCLKIKESIEEKNTLTVSPWAKYMETSIWMDSTL